MEELRTLVERARTGDLEAYGEIVRRFQDMAYGYAYSLLGDFHLAQDAAQEAFVQAYRDLTALREPAAFPGWFRRIVFKHCDRILRKRHAAESLAPEGSEPMSEEPGPAEAAEKQELRDRVLAAVRSLPEHQRTVTTLFYINGYSVNDIADFLETPAGTIKRRLHDSRMQLKERMITMVDESLKSVPLPDDFANVVVRRAASLQDLASAADLLSYSARRNPSHFQSPEDAEQAGIYVVGEDGEVEGAGYFNETELTVGSTVLRAVRPGEMGAEADGVPDPAFVRSFRACFKLARERGIHVAVIHGSQFDHAFCGFVPCFYYPVVTLPCDQAAGIVTRAETCEASDEQAEAGRRAYLHDPYAPNLSAYIGGGVPHVIRQDGAVVGYVRVNRNFSPADRYGMPLGYVTDITVQTREAALAVIRLARGLVQQGGAEEICLMQSHMTLITRTMLSLGGKYLLRGSCPFVGLDAEMVAVIDLIGLTRDMEREFAGRLENSGARDLQAAFSFEMGGHIAAFVNGPDRLKATTEKQSVHLRLPRWVLTRLYMGYYSGEDVLAMGPIPWDRTDGKKPDDPNLDNRVLDMPEAEATLFAALFPRLWPTSMPDPDVWPWVIGEPHPRYQGEEHKTAEMKAAIDALSFPWIGR